MGQVPLIGRRPMDIAEEIVDWNALVQRLAQFLRRELPVNAQLNGARCCGGDGKQQTTRGFIPGPDNQRGRSPEAGQRSATHCVTLCERGRRQMDAAQQLARPQHICMVAGYKIDGGNRPRRSAPRPRESSYFSATVSAIIAPAGNDMQIFPPTVAAFQILNEASSALLHSSNIPAAVQSAGAEK